MVKFVGSIKRWAVAQKGTRDATWELPIFTECVPLRLPPGPELWKENESIKHASCLITPFLRITGRNEEHGLKLTRSTGGLPQLEGFPAEAPQLTSTHFHLRHSSRGLLGASTATSPKGNWKRGWCFAEPGAGKSHFQWCSYHVVSPIHSAAQWPFLSQKFTSRKPACSVRVCPWAVT